MVLPRKLSLMNPYLMTGPAYEGGSGKSGWEGSGVPLDQPPSCEGAAAGPR